VINSARCFELTEFAAINMPRGSRQVSRSFDANDPDLHSSDEYSDWDGNDSSFLADTVTPRNESTSGQFQSAYADDSDRWRIPPCCHKDMGILKGTLPASDLWKRVASGIVVSDVSFR
jgi:hypothetical protein